MPTIPTKEYGDENAAVSSGASTTATQAAHDHGAATGGTAPGLTPGVIGLRGGTTLIRVAAPGTALHAAIAFNGAFPVAPTLQPAYPINVRITTGGVWASASAVHFRVTGSVHGVAGITEEIVVPANGAQTAGNLPFDPGSITALDVVPNAQWTGGTATFETGAKLGLPLPANFSALGSINETVWNEGGAPPTPAYEATAAIDTTNGTVTPTTAPDGAHSYRIEFSYSVPGDAGSIASHTHTIAAATPVITVTD